MKKLLLILYALSNILHAAGVKAELSSHEVVEGNPVQLRISAEGEKVRFPSITHIGNLPVEGRAQRQNTSVQIINGTSTMTHTTHLILTFTPKESMDIPPFEVEIEGKKYKTQPLHLEVSKATAPKGVSKRPFSLRMEADKQEVVVGQPLLVSVYFVLRDDVRLADNPQYDRPEFKGFLVKEVDDPKRYRKGSYHITRLQYILIPEAEGNYTIGPATAKIPLIDQSRQDIFGRYFGASWKPIASNRLDIHVKPAPQDADIIGRFYIETTIDKQYTKPNKPVNLTITIEGDGSLEDLQLEDYEIDGVTVYGDEPQVSTQVIGNKLKSRFVKKFAFIADANFTIPQRTLVAYDPRTKQKKVLRIPAYTIAVEASKKEPTTLAASQPKERSGSIGTNIELPDTPQTIAKEATTPQSAPSGVAWWWLLLSFVAGMGAMYLLRSVRWTPKASPFKEEEALKILYGHMSDDPQVEAMVRKLYAKKNGQKDVIIDKKELRALVERYRTP